MDILHNALFPVKEWLLVRAILNYISRGNVRGDVGSVSVCVADDMKIWCQWITL